MSDINELRERVAALRRPLVAHQADLRAAVDQDQADVGSKVAAMHHLVQALSITQSDHTEKLRRIEAGQTTIIALLNELISRDGGNDG